MLPIYHFFIVLIVFAITLNSVNSFNTCHFEHNCKQSSIECNNFYDLCFCRNNRLSPTGVCLQSSTVNNSCMIFQPCLYAKCILTNGNEFNFNDIKERNTVLQSFLRHTNHNKFLGFCRCDKSKPQLKCNYRYIGSHCTDQRYCSLSVAHSHCTDGVCACNQTHYHLDDNCLPKKTFEQICSDSSECQPSLYCKSSQCRCRKSYEYDVSAGICQYKAGSESGDITSSHNSGNLWDDIEKLGGFVIVVVLMLFLCTKKDSELQNDPLVASHRRRSSMRAHRQRSSSLNSHRPLTQTSSNASRSSAYRTFEEPVPIRQTIIMPSPAQLIRSLSSSSEDINYNPYQFDTLFPQQSDNDDPPSYEEAVKKLDKH